MSALSLIINCGSSSLKFAVIDQAQQTIFSGLAQALATADAKMHWQYKLEKSSLILPENTAHGEVIELLVKLISEYQLNEKIKVIGHRIVHGGEKFTQSVVITNEVLDSIKAVSSLAPLHNPANILGVELAIKHFKNVLQVAVFDTAFHQTLPEHAFLYALPLALYREHGVRRYGFHGTSHCYVAEQAAGILKKPLENTQLITAHLGNGCSITAIEQGRSVDTSMGFTPLAGFCMGTRSGDLDPGLINYLLTSLNYSPAALMQLLNQESGLKGLSQLSNDCRTLEQAMNQGNKQAELALTIFCYQIAKTIASYTAVLSQLDAIVFTGGIGENSIFIREKVIAHLAIFSIELSVSANAATCSGRAGVISKSNGIQVLVVPTNEELAISQDGFKLLAKQGTKKITEKNAEQESSVEQQDAK